MPLFSCFIFSHEDQWEKLLSTSKQPNLLTCLFPKHCTGNRSREPETLQPYLDLLVDELLQLSGKSVYNSYSKAPFLLKCEMSYVLNYPGVGKVFHVFGSGAYKGCVPGVKFKISIAYPVNWYKKSLFLNAAN